MIKLAVVGLIGLVCLFILLGLLSWQDDVKKPEKISGFKLKTGLEVEAQRSKD